jgi:uncharacterized Ntn-hydrolase superfamily protein
MRIILTLGLFLTIHVPLFATWSIILIDPETKEIGIAGASRTPNCYGIGEIIPGQGAIIVQAMSNTAARTKGLKMILSGYSPEEIISQLRDGEFDPERQQYAVVTLNHYNNPATYTGVETHPYNSAMTGDGFSVQGNTLPGKNVIRQIFEAVLQGRKDSLTIDHILMRALVAGALAGGDKRCGDQKATSAFIIVAKPNDKRAYLNLSIFGQPKGGQNAVDMLEHKYEKWTMKHSSRNK